MSPAAGRAARRRPPCAGPRRGPRARAGPLTLSRSELDGALADFATLTRGSRLTLGARASPSPTSPAARCSSGSASANGDHVVAINGSPLRSVDDAADLYARLGTFNQLRIEVIRRRRHLTLHCALVK